MKVLDPGHKYELASLDGTCAQTLSFVKREGEHYPGNIGSYPGTTSQDVIRCLIERAEYVNHQIPCAETQAVRQCLLTALFLLEVRAARVKGRSLEIDYIGSLAHMPACGQCGHVQCSSHLSSPGLGGRGC